MPSPSAIFNIDTGCISCLLWPSSVIGDELGMDSSQLGTISDIINMATTHKWAVGKLFPNYMLYVSVKEDTISMFIIASESVKLTVWDIMYKNIVFALMTKPALHGYNLIIGALADGDISLIAKEHQSEISLDGCEQDADILARRIKVVRLAKNICSGAQFSCGIVGAVTMVNPRCISIPDALR